MVREVYDRVLIGVGNIMNGKCAFPFQRINYLYTKGSGVIFLHIGACIGKLERRLIGVIRYFYIPHTFVEADLTAVSGILSVVCEKDVLNTVKSKFRFTDAIAYTTDDGSLISLCVEVAVYIVKSAYNIGLGPVFPLHPKIHDGSAEVDDPRPENRGIGKRICSNRSIVRESSEGFFNDHFEVLSKIIFSPDIRRDSFPANVQGLCTSHQYRALRSIREPHAPLWDRRSTRRYLRDGGARFCSLLFCR